MTGEGEKHTPPPLRNAYRQPGLPRVESDVEVAEHDELATEVIGAELARLVLGGRGPERPELLVGMPRLRAQVRALMASLRAAVRRPV